MPALENVLDPLFLKTESYFTSYFTFETSWRTGPKPASYPAGYTALHVQVSSGTTGPGRARRPRQMPLIRSR